MKIFKHIGYALIIIWCFGIIACTEMDDYKKYLTGKEVLYTGKVDSLKAFTGRNRVKLSFLLISDPKVTAIKVYWNSRSNSSEIAVTKTAGIDTVNIIIPDLDQGTYNFEIFTFDKDSNKSVPVLVTSRSYGSYYESALINRQISSFNMNGGNANVSWGTTDSASLGTEVTYTDILDVIHKNIVPNKEKSTELIDFKTTIPISYRSLFKPDSLCIDTFYAAPETKVPSGI